MGPVLEREHELAAAHDLIDRSRSGTAAALCLAGPPGAGKTTVLGLWAATARDHGIEVWRAAGRQLEAASPFGILRQLLGRPVADLDAAAREHLAQGPARLALDLVGDRPEEAGRARETTFDAAPIDPARVAHSVYWLLDALTEHRRALLVVDDCQWGDESSLHALDALVSRSDELPVAWALAAREPRTSARAPAVSTLLTNPVVRTLRLDPLGPASVARLVQEATGRSVGAGFAAACTEATGGNPFLVGELARLVADGDLDPADHAGTTGSTTAGTASGPADPLRVATLVPATVVDAVVRRLAALPPPDRDVALATAVLESAPLRLVAACAGADARTAGASVARLREAGLVDGSGALRIRHALLRSALLEAADPEELAALRRAGARLLDAEPDGTHRAAALALQTAGIGDPAVVDCLVRAAAAASEAGAPEEAARLLARAEAEPPAPDRRPHVALQLGLAQMRAGDPACAATLAQACERDPDPERRAEAALALSLAYNFGGAYARSVDVLDRVRADLAPGSPLEARVEAGIVQASLQVPHLVESGRARLRALEPVAGDTPDERVLLGLVASVRNATSRPVPEVLAAARAAIAPSSRGPEQHPEEHEWSLVRLQLASVGACR